MILPIIEAYFYIKKKMQRLRLTFTLLVAISLWLAVAGPMHLYSQEIESGSVPSASIDPKAEKILQRALEVLGGSNFMNSRTIVSRGLYTQFQAGRSGIPVPFADYIVFPDKERTEFRGAGVRVIQANMRDSGWIYDGNARTLKDMSEEQVEDFRNSIRRSVEYVLRGHWRKDGASLTYVGRREAGVGRRNEVARIEYTDGLWVEIEVGVHDGLPAKVVYKRKLKDEETEQEREVLEEDRFAQFVTIQGIQFPMIVDRYRDGVQTSRINYSSVEFNRPLADTLFARPENAKAVKWN